MHNAQLLTYLFGYSDTARVGLQIACAPFELFMHVYALLGLMMGASIFIVTIGIQMAYFDKMR